MDIGVKRILNKFFLFFFFLIFILVFRKLLSMITKKSLKISTAKNFEIHDITSQINDLIDINDGIISIFSKHSPSAIVVN